MRARYRWMVGSFMALAMSSAWAGGGRITFSGAVVTPTCVSAHESSVFASTPHQRFACDGAATAASRNPSAYEFSVARLEQERITGDPLLAYFAGYLPPVARGTARLVTRTYQ